MRNARGYIIVGTDAVDDHIPLRLYFAYGSNLNRDQMIAAGGGSADAGEFSGRCPDCALVAPFVLEDYRLVFVGERTKRWGRGGVATIVPDGGARVHGALYRLSAADEAALDRFERVNAEQPEAANYYKAEQICCYDDEPVYTYIATQRLAPLNRPNQRYLDTIRRGYEQWGLPLSGLEGIEAFPVEPLREAH